MITYLITWASVFILSYTAQNFDYRMSTDLTVERVTHNRISNAFLFFAAIILVFVAGCRYYIGSDYYAYYGWYKSYASSFQERVIGFDEPGISLIYNVVVRFFDDGFACVFAANAVMIFLVLFTIKRNTDNTGMAFVLYSFICWTATFNGMRQALATSVLFLGLPFLRDKKIIPYMCVVFCAFLCHKSAIVFVLLYFAVYLKVGWKNLAILTIASVVVIFSYDKVFEFTDLILEKDLNVEGTYISKSVNFFRVAANIAPAIYFAIIYWKKERQPIHDFYLNLLIVNGLIALVTFKSAYLARLVIYMGPFRVLAISELVKQDTKNRRIIEIVIIIMYFLFESYEVLHSRDLTPFKWIWSRNAIY